MQDMEKRISEAFPEAMLHMEEEQAFWEARARWNSTWDALDDAGFWGSRDAAENYNRDSEESDDTLVSEDIQRAMDVYVVATGEYRAAEKALKAIPTNVLKAKRNMAKARYCFAEAQLKRRESELHMVALNEFLEDATPRKEMSDEWTDAWIKVEFAKAEWFKLKNKYEALKYLGEG